MLVLASDNNNNNNECFASHLSVRPSLHCICLSFACKTTTSTNHKTSGAICFYHPETQVYCTAAFVTIATSLPRAAAAAAPAAVQLAVAAVPAMAASRTATARAHAQCRTPAGAAEPRAAVARLVERRVRVRVHHRVWVPPAAVAVARAVLRWHPIETRSVAGVNDSTTDRGAGSNATRPAGTKR